MTDVTTVHRRTVDRMQVRLEHLDTLLSLAGEVIITSANLQDLERRANSGAASGRGLGQEGLHLIKTSNETTRRISQNLHNLVMAIRLVEIGETYRLLRRPVRDLSRNLGRDVDLVFEGADTMIDKALAERLVDPLLHLLRNAIDHGIEAPIERKGTGKALTGRVVVRAIDTEHHTEIQVEDDGAGIDTEAVYARAVALLGDRCERRPLLDLICQPGLSTSGQVTATSGRGVGLDLVRSVVEEFNGELSLQTARGTGTVFHLRIPKLRAVNIIDALTLRAGQDLYALPIEQIVASIGLRRADINLAFGRNRHFIYQGEVVPLHCLQTVLGQPATDVERDPLPVIIVRGRCGLAAFIVSEFLGPQKLVNIPLDAGLCHHAAIGGTAVFTGGKLGLTVDIDALVETVHGLAVDPGAAARQSAGTRPAAARVDAASSPEAAAPRDRRTGGSVASPRAASNGAAVAATEAADLRSELLVSLQALQEDLLSLESDPNNRDQLNAAFRRLHAAKGHLTVLAAEPQADLAHLLETVLDYLRADRLVLSPERMDLLLDGVTCLLQAADQLPGVPTAPAADLLAGLQELTATSTLAAEDGLDLGDLIRQSFDVVPTVQLQVLSALKRGERTYETYLSFDPGRQPSFLAAYVLLRRVGKAGTVLATLPSVQDIEQGRCGREVKVLWSTPLDEADVNRLYDRLAGLYNLREHRSIPATIFRYENAL
ncbi:MAG: ATP-binding protein [Candidatus Krumholzibacteria bacterium]|jgi:chemotaxis protein histidine kinase CheA|nr:ATP-binding protein [Candidatus Krumholzibacteria bacterium]